MLKQNFKKLENVIYSSLSILIFRVIGNLLKMLFSAIFYCIIYQRSSYLLPNRILRWITIRKTERTVDALLATIFGGVFWFYQCLMLIKNIKKRTQQGEKDIIKKGKQNIKHVTTTKTDSRFTTIMSIVHTSSIEIWLKSTLNYCHVVCIKSRLQWKSTHAD